MNASGWPQNLECILILENAEGRGWSPHDIAEANDVPDVVWAEAAEANEEAWRRGSRTAVP